MIASRRHSAGEQPSHPALADNAAEKGMSVREFVNSGHDPTSVAVVAEDAAAVSGCVIAAAALAATQMTGSSVYDATGSVAVGALLGFTAMYLINSNRLLLLGRSLGVDKMKHITDHMRADPVVAEVYRAKSEELGAGTYRFAAEIEFSGTKVVERYLDQGDGAKREMLHGGEGAVGGQHTYKSCAPICRLERTRFLKPGFETPRVEPLRFESIVRS